MFQNANLVFFTLTKPPSPFSPSSQCAVDLYNLHYRFKLVPLKKRRLQNWGAPIFPNLKKIYNGVYVYIRYASQTEGKKVLIASFGNIILIAEYLLKFLRLDIEKENILLRPDKSDLQRVIIQRRNYYDCSSLLIKYNAYHYI